MSALLSSPAPGDIRWTLHRHPGGSEKFGPCQMCGQYVAAVVHQSAMVAYLDSPERGMCWTTYGAPPSWWGHEECVVKARKTWRRVPLTESAR